MKRLIQLSFMVVFAVAYCTQAFAQQSTTIAGTIKNTTKEALSAVSVTIKGKTVGTFTDDKGNFKFTTTDKPPFTLVFSSVGYTTKEVLFSGNNLSVELEPNYVLGDEVVVSASRVAERILESPVSIERMGQAAIRNAPAPNFYESIANLKGVDMITSGLNFRTLSTRGFNGSGNLRFNQLVDGMDNQAPALNFSVGNISGMTELDVDNAELLQGASSALYGSGGMNGTLLLNSKNPFKYQGLSFQIKQGYNHIDGKQREISPYYDWSLRWAKKVSEKFAFKIGVQYTQAQDWQGNDERNLARNNVLSNLKAGDRASDPNYDGVNVFGDEASASMLAFAQAVQFQANAGLLAASGGAYNLNNVLGLLPANATPAQIASFIGAQPAPFQPTVQGVIPFNLGIRNNFFGSQNVSRLGYAERDLVDYNTYNVKLTGSLNYKITKEIEASLVAYFGTGTTVYTGADRYSLKNFKLGQYKFEIKAKDWFVRAYTTQENSGDSYTATTAAVAVNNAWKSNQTWFQQYTGTYAGARLQGAGDAAAHVAARNAAETGRFLPGTAAFDAAFNTAINTPVSKGGAQFADQSALYHYEGQYNLSSIVKVVDVIVGASYRNYSLNSKGTIFADTTGPIKFNEFGGYIQFQKKFFNDVLKLTASGRYDKSQNFDGRFTPRISALIRVAKDNNIRLSYQQAYRFPSTQDQYINLATPSSILIGGLPQFNTFFQFNTSPAYSAESIAAYRASVGAGSPNPTLLKAQAFTNLKPETVQSYEIGYRGVITKKLLVDAYAYYSQYNNFIARVAVGRGQSRNPANTFVELASPFTTTNYSFVSNTNGTVNVQGWGVSAEYQLYKRYVLNVNVSGDKLQNPPAGIVTFFNTPGLRYNIGLSNENVYKNFGFNVLYRWQDKMNYEGTFGSGEVPSYGVLDAFVSYKFVKSKSLFKVGATNLMNKYYRSAFGNPQVGALYYASYGFNIF